MAGDGCIHIINSNSGKVNQLQYEDLHLCQTFQSQGNRLAEDGRYREALTKWEAALTLTPHKAVLHEQKAQTLLEIGETWNSLKAATGATELEPLWFEMLQQEKFMLQLDVEMIFRSW